MRLVALLYGVVCYVLFFVSFLYLIAFVGGGMVPLIHVPKTLDWGASTVPENLGMLVNIGLLLLFGLQHSIMARQSFKKVLTRVISWPVERSTYVLATTAVLVLLYVYWSPNTAVVWNVTTPFWMGVLTAAFYLGFGLTLLSTFLINHFELFGLEQVWRNFTKSGAHSHMFKVPLFYAMVRHPLYLGLLIAFWSTPTMTAGHLLFTAIWTAYIFVAIGYEERDLITVFGDQYRQYMTRVPMIVPFGRRKD